MTRDKLYKDYKDKQNKYNVPGYTNYDIERIYGPGNDVSKYIANCLVCGSNMLLDDYCNECGFTLHHGPYAVEDLKSFIHDYRAQKEKQPDYVWFVDKVQGYKWQNYPDKENMNV